MSSYPLTDPKLVLSPDTSTITPTGLTGSLDRIFFFVVDEIWPLNFCWVSRILSLRVISRTQRGVGHRRAGMRVTLTRREPRLRRGIPPLGGEGHAICVRFGKVNAHLSRAFFYDAFVSSTILFSLFLVALSALWVRTRACSLGREIPRKDLLLGLVSFPRNSPSVRLTRILGFF